jgi:hypothetical protein
VTWIPISEKLPITHAGLVLIRYKNNYGSMRTTIGWYCPAKTHESADFDDSVEEEYDEETGTYYMKEGWVDESHESEFHYSISGVTHWRPLPDPPESESK